MIPLKDLVTVVKPQGFDRWGEPLNPIEEVVKCRFDLNTNSRKTAVGNGEEIVYSATFLFKGILDMKHDYRLKWVDEFGVLQEERPIKIIPVKNIGGKVILTKVLV